MTPTRTGELVLSLFVGIILGFFICLLIAWAAPI